MKLSHIMEVLASGELVNLNLAEDNINIKPEKQVIVLRAINRALTDLYARFLLRRSFVDIDVVVGQSTYKVAVEDFVEIMDVYVNGKKLAQNSEYILLGVNEIGVKYKLGILDALRVEYKAGHQVLTELDISMDTEVNLPEQYLNAVAYFVANCLITPRQNQLDGDLNEGAVYARKYQDEIVMLNHQGIDVESLNDTNLFYGRGFV